jgi:bacteriocin biosynthesis cyclodehydratase domain-containing protein
MNTATRTPSLDLTTLTDLTDLTDASDLSNLPEIRPDPQPDPAPPPFRRPRVLPGLPVLHREPGEIQIGTDPDCAVVISGLPESLTPVLHRLDGSATLDEWLARVSQHDRPILLRVLTELGEMGLVEDASRPDDRPGMLPARISADCTAWALRSGAKRLDTGESRAATAVVVHGSGRIAVSVATMLAASGVGWVHSVADGVVQAEDTGCGYLDEDIGSPRGPAVKRAVRRCAPETRTNRLPPRRSPDLVILADVMVPEPRLAASLAAAGVPHLLVRATEGSGVVGPLIVPGRTCCLRCLDLHTMDVDPCWPVLATQLAAKPLPADIASVHATAAFAVSQALRVLHGPANAADLPTWGSMIEIDPFTGCTRQTACTPHPQCPCGQALRNPADGEVIPTATQVRQQIQPQSDAPADTGAGRWN